VNNVTAKILAEMYENNLLLSNVKDAAEELLRWEWGTPRWQKAFIGLEMALRDCR
jgi:hypothetical protein